MKIMVLADGVTFSGLEGCKIVEIPDGMSFEDIEAALRAMKNGAKVIEEFKENTLSSYPRYRVRDPRTVYHTPKDL
jgi:hypothetical protein